MRNAILRRLVHDEEVKQHEKRLLLQQQLRKEQAHAQALAAAAAASATASASRGNEVSSDTTEVANNENLTTQPVEPELEQVDEELEEEEDFQQKHLLSAANAHWRCIEDSTQAYCIALNQSKTMFAVGERDGRVSIWDNVSIRVILRELDPTLISISKEDLEEGESEGKAADGEERTDEEMKDANDGEDVDMNSQSIVNGKVAAEDEDTGDDEGSATNDDDGSVEADDDHDDDNEDDDAGSVEDGDGATEEEDEDDDDNDSVKNIAKRARNSTRKSKNDHSSDQTPAGTDSLSTDDLKCLKDSLKVVTHCAWSCDSRWIFAGCEEKSNRRGRLCVWDVELATVFACFSFDGVVNCVSAHPRQPELVVVCYYNSVPEIINVKTRSRTPLDVPLKNTTITTTVPSNSRHPSLTVCAKFGTTGKWIYCGTSKSTIAIFDSSTLACLHSVTLPVLIQYVDLAVDYRETALLLTSSKGIHEYAVTETEEHLRCLTEVRLHSTGAVRAPWALCCFTGDEGFVIGTPIVRHRHVGENGLYTWHRGTGKVQHNAGVKDGVNSLAWDTQRQSILAVSTIGSVHVFEEEFKTTWPGAMYPAGFRVVNDNELHSEVMDVEDEEQKKLEAAQLEIAKAHPIDIFTIEDEPQTSNNPLEGLDPVIQNKLLYLPAIPIPHYHKRHHHAFQSHVYHEEKHFGLGQSVFEPFKVPAKPKPASSRSRKKKSTTTVPESTDSSERTTPSTQASNSSSKKSKSKFKSSSQKRKRLR